MSGIESLMTALAILADERRRARNKRKAAQRKLKNRKRGNQP
jgi:hypothetical protein